MAAPVLVCPPMPFMSSLRWAIGSDCAATAVIPIAIAETASTVRIIEWSPLIGGPGLPGFPVNPGKRMLFLEKPGAREPGEDHDPVKCGPKKRICAALPQPAPAQIPVANRAMITMITI